MRFGRRRCFFRRSRLALLFVTRGKREFFLFCFCDRFMQRARGDALDKSSC